MPSEATTEHTVRVSSIPSDRAQDIHHVPASLDGHGHGHGHGHRNAAVCPEHGRALCQFSSSCCVHKPVECSYCPPPRSCCCVHHAGDCCYCGVVQGSLSQRPVDSVGSSDDTSSRGYAGTSDRRSGQDSSAEGSSVQGGSVQEGSVQTEVYKPESYTNYIDNQAQAEALANYHAQAQAYYQAQAQAQKLAQSQSNGHYQVHPARYQAQGNGQPLDQVLGVNGQAQYPVQVEAQHSAQHPTQSNGHYQVPGQAHDQLHPVQEQTLHQAQHSLGGYVQVQPEQVNYYAQGNVQHNGQHQFQYLAENGSHDHSGNQTEDHAHIQAQSHKQGQVQSNDEHDWTQPDEDHEQDQAQNESQNKGHYPAPQAQGYAQIQPEEQIHYYAQENAQDNTQHLAEYRSQEVRYQAQNLTEDHAHGNESHEQGQVQSQDERFDWVQQVEDEIQAQSWEENDRQTHQDEEVVEDQSQIHEQGQAQNESHNKVFDWAQQVEDEIQARSQDHSHGQVHAQESEYQAQNLTGDDSYGQGQSHEQGQFQSHDEGLDWAQQVEDDIQEQSRVKLEDQVRQTEEIVENQSQGYKDQVDNTQSHADNLAEGYTQEHSQDERLDWTQEVEDEIQAQSQKDKDGQTWDQDQVEKTDQSHVENLAQDYTQDQSQDERDGQVLQTEDVVEDQSQSQIDNSQSTHDQTENEGHFQNSQAGDHVQHQSQDEKYQILQTEDVTGDHAQGHPGQDENTQNAVQDPTEKVHSQDQSRNEKDGQVQQEYHAQGHQGQSENTQNAAQDHQGQPEEKIHNHSQDQSRNEKDGQVQQEDHAQGHQGQSENTQNAAQGHHEQQEDNAQNAAQILTEDPTQQQALTLPREQAESKSQDQTRHKSGNQTDGQAQSQEEEDQAQAAPRALIAFTLNLLETSTFSDCRLIIKMPMNNLHPIPFPTHKVLLSRSARLVTLLDANKATGDIEATTGDTFSMIKAFETALQNLYGSPYLTPGTLKAATADALGYEGAVDEIETLLPVAFPIRAAMADYTLCYIASGAFLGDRGVVETAARLAIQIVHSDNIEMMLSFALQPGRLLFRSPSATVSPEAAVAAAGKDVSLDMHLLALLKKALGCLFEAIGEPFTVYASARPGRTTTFPDRIPASLREHPGSVVMNPKLADVKFGSLTSVSESRPRVEVERASGVLLSLSFEALKVAFEMLDERGLWTEEAAGAVVAEREKRRVYALRVYAMFRARVDKEVEQFGKKRAKKLKREYGIKEEEVKVLGYRESIVVKDSKIGLVRDWIGLQAP